MYVYTYIEGTMLHFILNGKHFTKKYNTVEGAIHAQEKLIEFGRELGFGDVTHPE
jgi:hypothetical protein